MEGFEKIEFGQPASQPVRTVSPTSPTVSGGNKLGLFRKKPGVFLLVIIGLIILSSLVIVLPAQKVIKSAKKTSAQAKATVDAIKKQNIALAGTELEKTRVSLLETQKDLQSVGILRFIPIAAWYYNDADHMVKAGFQGLSAARVLIDAVAPYADVLGLKGQGSFVMGSAENRIQTAVTTMSKVTPKIDDIEKYMLLAKVEMDRVNPNHYPPLFALGKLRNTIITVKKITGDGTTFIEEAKPLIKVLPDLLGANTPKKYLIIFQNDKELRPTGGFITAYSIFSVDRGKISVDKSDNIYNLDNSIPNKPKAPQVLVDNLKVSTLNLRDSNFSPDFIESMKTFNSLYDKASGKVKVDGIIALDTSVLVSTIKILDDRVDAAGQTFTTKKDSRCNCAQVIYALESSITTPLNLDYHVTNIEAVNAGRKAIIGDLLYAIMQKALKSSPKVYWGPLFQDMITQINQKHVLLDLEDAGAQQGVHAVNADGKIREFDGDFLHINEANLGGQKANLFVTEDVSQNYDIKSDGSIVKTVTINYKNPYRASDCNLERGNLCLNAVLKNWLRIYVPKGTTLVDSKGSEIKLKSYEELGKTVFEGFLTVRPQGAATFTISYKLPFSYPSKDSLALLIQKQPGTYANEYEIKVNGRKTDKFPLLADKELKISR